MRCRVMPCRRGKFCNLLHYPPTPTHLCRSNPYSVHEVHVDEEQLTFFKAEVGGSCCLLSLPKDMGNSRV